MTREEWRDRAIEHGIEIAKLKQQLEIAVEALKEYADGRYKKYGLAVRDYIAKEALKEIEELYK